MTVRFIGFINRLEDLPYFYIFLSPSSPPPQKRVLFFRRRHRSPLSGSSETEAENGKRASDPERPEGEGEGGGGGTITLSLSLPLLFRCRFIYLSFLLP